MNRRKRIIWTANNLFSFISCSSHPSHPTADMIFEQISKLDFKKEIGMENGTKRIKKKNKRNEMDKERILDLNSQLQFARETISTDFQLQISKDELQKY